MKLFGLSIGELLIVGAVSLLPLVPVALVVLALALLIRLLLGR